MASNAKNLAELLNTDSTVAAVDVADGSITTAKLGSKIKSGATIGFLGGPKVNGDYPPHLHFQIILDLQGNFGDYPGVCSEENLSFYKSNCPNPHLFLNI